MNIVVAIIVGLNVHQNASKCTISKENMPKFLPTPVGAFGASMRVPSALDRPDHISRPLTSNPEYAPDVGPTITPCKRPVTLAAACLVLKCTNVSFSLFSFIPLLRSLRTKILLSLFNARPKQSTKTVD